MANPCAICGETGPHPGRCDHRPDRLTWNSERSAWTVKETDTHLIEVVQFLFTAAIVTTTKVDTQEYDNRWCYESVPDAVAAAVAWDPAVDPEPEGWHRHPITGRRRPHGDKSKETIIP